MELEVAGQGEKGALEDEGGAVGALHEAESVSASRA